MFGTPQLNGKASLFVGLRRLNFGVVRFDAAFTLTEVLIALALALLVVTMVLTVLVKNQTVWRDGLAQIQISNDSRIIRERVLRGINGQYGLRHARRLQTVCLADRIIFQDAASSNGLAIIFASNQPVFYTYQSVTNILLRGGALVEKFAATLDGSMLDMDLTLALLDRGKKHTQYQKIKVHLLNE